ncbi:MAG: hypothetical protein WEA77_02405 [Hyphomonas sp.]|uniref:hypothetical protein n=1 Tax=Hyphomonas sp. TaxID=87 RepID=UPI0034A0827E
MTDYYDLPPPEKERASIWWAVVLLLLLFLLALWATWWSLRLQPGELGEEPVLPAAALPAAPLVRTEPPPLAPAITPEPEVPAEPAATEPVGEVQPQAGPPPLFSDARWRETARFTGTDAAGRVAEFTAYVLVGDETWTYARADAVFAAGLSQPVETAFGKLELGAGICDLTGVIAVGAASVEGTSEQNTFLSHTRGHALRAAIAANLPCEPGDVAASVLDLGYSRADVTCPAGKAICPDVSAPQRPIAMVLVRADDPGTDIGEALKTGIAAHEAAGASVLPGVSMSDYSAFDLRISR